MQPAVDDEGNAHSTLFNLASIQGRQVEPSLERNSKDLQRRYRYREASSKANALADKVHTLFSSRACINSRRQSYRKNAWGKNDFLGYSR
jgi:hypothetical protein